MIPGENYQPLASPVRRNISGEVIVRTELPGFHRLTALRAEVYLPASTVAFTEVSQPYRSGLEPSMIEKNSFCSRSVTGPRRPVPTCMWSTDRMGVISAAVPLQ